jgi:hypothetical protein
VLEAVSRRRWCNPVYVRDGSARDQARTTIMTDP